MFQTQTITGDGTVIFGIDPGKKYIVEAVGVWGGGTARVYVTTQTSGMPLSVFEIDLASKTANFQHEFVTACPILKIGLSGSTGGELIVRLLPIL